MITKKQGLTDLSAYVAPIQKRVPYTIAPIGDKTALDAWKAKMATLDIAHQAKRRDGAINAFNAGSTTKTFKASDYQKRYEENQAREEKIFGSRSSITESKPTKPSFWDRILEFITSHTI